MLLECEACDEERERGESGELPAAAAGAEAEATRLVDFLLLHCLATQPEEVAAIVIVGAGGRSALRVYAHQIHTW